VAAAEQGLYLGQQLLQFGNPLGNPLNGSCGQVELLVSFGPYGGPLADGQQVALALVKSLVQKLSESLPDVVSRR